jgi:hypothetical protein
VQNWGRTGTNTRQVVANLALLWCLENGLQSLVDLFRNFPLDFTALVMQLVVQRVNFLLKELTLVAGRFGSWLLQ